MLSYFKYYIIKTQQAQKSVVLKLCGYSAAFRPDVGGGVVPQAGGCWGSVRGVEISLRGLSSDVHLSVNNGGPAT